MTRRRLSLLIAAGLLASVAVPAVAATCIESVSGGIGGSGFLGGPRTTMELPRGGEMGVIVCKEGTLRQVFSATNAGMFVCE
ncbi:hypothetical protein ACM64Y_12850 [Novispirillum sp. DQ9]|uniref:hypothetical protein n=1 Tax=Novispirillum sp. DQ9 TaxID=3398612 RepID=UPI003C7D3964